MRRVAGLLAPLMISGAAAAAIPARASFPPGAGHGDPIAPILLALLLISIAAALGAAGMRRIGQPAVLGELLAGMLAANLAYAFREPVITVLREGETIAQIVRVSVEQNIGVAAAAREVLPDSAHTRQLIEILSGPVAPAALSIHHFIDLLSRLAVIVLLFLVGLETNLGDMRRVGRSAFQVAVVGVVVPFMLGLGVVAWWMPAAPAHNDIFIGAILTATSVGITARVFRDMRQSHRPEAHIILGAAVIDDVLGLIVLAVVSGLVVSGTVRLAEGGWIVLKAVAFLAAAITAGLWITPRLARRAARWEIQNLKLLFGLGFALLLSWLANLTGLATIVGAFAAGLVLEELYLENFQGRSLRELLSPVESLIVPVFFVLMGMQAKLETFAQPGVALIAAALTLAAIAGKIVSGLAAGSGVDRLTVGIGMMPRGEVGLIFASIGRGLGVVSDAMFSAVVIMVLLTTLLAPPLLKFSLARSQRT